MNSRGGITLTQKSLLRLVAYLSYTGKEDTVKLIQQYGQDGAHFTGDLNNTVMGVELNAIKNGTVVANIVVSVSDKLQYNTLQSILFSSEHRVD